MSRTCLSRTFRRRVGFTLVELLVVIAIIGTLVALLMPAVQSAREAARRMSCSNNLHNIAIAMQNYHDSLGTFPSGYINGGPSLSESWAWGALLLPFLEQKNLHDLIGVSTGSFNQMIQAKPQVVFDAIQTPLKIYMCPSDTGFVGRGIANGRNYNQGLGFTAAGLTSATASLSNYMGVSGHRDVVGGTANTGLYFGDGFVRMADIIDGTSNTFAVGERDSLNCRSGMWVGVRNSPGTTTGGPAVVIGHSRPKLNQPDPPILWSTDHLGCGEGFSSMHPNGAMFAKADGSVSFVTNTISHNWYGSTAQGAANDHKDQSNGVYQRLMSRNDKLTVGDY